MLTLHFITQNKEKNEKIRYNPPVVIRSTYRRHSTATHT